MSFLTNSITGQITDAALGSNSSFLGRMLTNNEELETAREELRQTSEDLAAAKKQLEEKCRDLELRDRSLSEAHLRLQEKQTENETMKHDLERVKTNATTIFKMLDEENKLMDETKKKLDEKKNELAAKQMELDEGKNQYQLLNSSYKELRQGRKRLEILNAEYEKFRQWIEEQAFNSYGRVNFTEFTSSELDAITDKSLLGKGGYGNVYKAVIHNTPVAIKILEGGRQGEKEFNHEVDILKRIRHPNLVTLLGVCRERFTLVYEFLPNGSLEDRLTDTNKRKLLSWKERIMIAANICSALVFLHNTKPNPIAHGDLKPANILFDINNVCKLSDFGTSRILQHTSDTATPFHKTTEPMYTESYVDPGFILYKKLNPQSDVFALGIILLQLVTGLGAKKLREWVLNDKLDGKNLETLVPAKQKRMLKEIVDKELVEWPENDALINLICLGLQCSDPDRKKRPDLATEVCTVIYSMIEDASQS